MTKVDDGLSDKQAFALLFETDSARTLGAYGLYTLRNARLLEITRDPIMTLLAIGTEKLLKMGLGLVHLAEHGIWPPKSRFKNVWRHDLSLMAEELLPKLRARLPHATNRSSIEPLLEAVEESPAFVPLLAALSRYGVDGRFYHLDALADDPQPGERPDSMWARAENALLTTRPDLHRRMFETVTDPPAYERVMHDLHAAMAECVEQFWDMLCMAGVQGMLGPRGKGWGFDVNRKNVVDQLRREMG